MKIADALIVAGVEIGDRVDAHLFGGGADRVQEVQGTRGASTRQPPPRHGVAVAKEMIFEPPEGGITSSQPQPVRPSWRQ